jgi:signal transduction histidine kinase
MQNQPAVAPRLPDGAKPGSADVCRRHAIEDAIRSLVENAVAYTPPRTEVVVDVKAPGIVNVVDRGLGIPPGDRGTSWTASCCRRDSPGQGSGLGLAIVNEIMKAHRGNVHVADNPHGGAVFTWIFQRVD